MKVIFGFIRQWLWSILAVGAVLWLTLSSDPLNGAQHAIWFEGADKVYHAVMFFGVASALFFDYKRAERQRALTLGVIIGVCLSVAAFGVADELAQQYLTATRTGEVMDFVADIVGIVLAAAIMPRLLNFIFRERS